jgi:preprotein translocase subunit YajC
MSWMPAVVLLQAEAERSPGLLQTPLVPMILIIGVIYFLIFRPQQKQQKETQEMRKAVDKGDTIITTGGIHGKVTGATDDTLTLDIAQVKGDRVRIKIARSAVDRKVTPGDGGES